MISTMVGRIAEDDAKDIIIQILWVNEYLYLQGVVRCDLKLENFMVKISQKLEIRSTENETLLPNVACRTLKLAIHSSSSILATANFGESASITIDAGKSASATADPDGSISATTNASDPPHCHKNHFLITNFRSFAKPNQLYTFFLMSFVGYLRFSSRSCL
ncbi:hypothetical protein L1887_23100 [Cichorium endivia]|nr:hypothetical protein L1887_23100 [Cichorium endivia]